MVLAALAILLLMALSTDGIARAAGGTAIGWEVLSGGGAPSTGGNIIINDTFGQPFIGPSSSGNTSLGAGYWYGLGDTVDCSRVVTVVNANDSNAGSLRQAIADVCTDGTITFDNDYTIPLSSTLTIDKHMSIDGAGHSVTISGNDAVRVFVVNSGVTATIQNLTITRGYSTGDGGAVHSSGTLNLNRVTVSHNQSRYGAILGNGTLTVNNSLFDSNTASYGGAIMNWNGTAVVTNSTFISNTATYGGGIWVNAGSVTVANSTFAYNSASQGGGIYTVASLTLVNNTFSGNSAGLGSALRIGSGGSTNSTNSIFVRGTTGNNCHGTTGISGLNNLANDTSCDTLATYSSSILLGTLGDYGGSMQTIPLLPGSSAIDAGDPAHCPVSDQRGDSRLGVCDIGAFESQGFTLAISGGDNQSTTITAAFTTPLSLTVTANAAIEPVTGGQVSFTPPGSGASAVISGSPATIDADGAVSITATANDIAGGPYQIIASAAGAASSVNFGLTNLKADTTTAINASEAVPAVGSTVYLTATVVSNAPGTLIPYGTVTFTDGGTTLCSEVPLDASGQAVCAMTAALPPGVHTLQAQYPGNANLNASAAELTQTVRAADLAIIKTVTPSGIAPGEAITYTLAFTNAGDTLASGVVITDIVPAHIQVAGVFSSGVAITDTHHIPAYVWQAADLAPGAGGVITITGILTTGLPGGMIIANTALIGSDMPEAVTANNASAADLSVLNTAPVLASIPNQSVNELTMLEFIATATDINGDDLSFSLDVGAPAGAVVNPASGLFTWTPTEAQGPDIYTVTVRVSDGDLDDFETIQITVNEVNIAPVATEDAYEIAEDEVLVVAAPGLLDNDNDEDIPTQILTVVLDTPPSQGTLVLAADSSFVYTPTLNFNGEVTFTYIVSDGLLTDTAVVTITVTPVNDLPEVDAGEDVDTFEGDLVHFDGIYSDVGLRGIQAVTITWNFGDGITTTGTLTPTHTYADDGVYTATLTVDDGEGGVASDSLVVTVENVAPVLEPISDQSIIVGEVLTLTAAYSDPGILDTHRATIDWGDGYTATIDLDAGITGFNFAHAFNAASTYTVTVTLTDDDGGSDTITFSVNVQKSGYFTYLPTVVKK